MAGILVTPQQPTIAHGEIASAALTKGSSVSTASGKQSVLIPLANESVWNRITHPPVVECKNNGSTPGHPEKYVVNP